MFVQFCFFILNNFSLLKTETCSVFVWFIFGYNFGVLVILIIIQFSIVRVNLITKEFCSLNKDYELKSLVKNYFDSN